MKLKKKLSAWISPKYLTDSFLHKAPKLFLKQKPFPHLVLPHFFQKNKAMLLRKTLLTLSYERKDADLFSFLQSDDLVSLQNECIKEFVSFYKSNALKQYIALLAADNAIKDVDLSAFIYKDGDYLLPHDDMLEGRKVAYVINFSERFKKSEGGALQLFSTKNNNIPLSVVKSFSPRFNTLFLFQVSPRSFHQVEEVMAAKKRVSIGGWFHDRTLLLA